jgi:hypothetical protein
MESLVFVKLHYTALNIYLYLNTMKKIFGFILLSIGGYMLISLIMEFFGVAEEVKEATKAQVGDPEGFDTGIIIGRILLSLIALIILFFGFRLMKKANEEAVTASPEDDNKEA